MREYLAICKKTKKCGELRKIKGLGYCAKISDKLEEDEIYDFISNGWHNITLMLDGYEFHWTPENYFFIYGSESNGQNVCLGFDGDNRQNILLGTTFMHGYDIIFDKEKYRMGFVPADCNRIKTIAEINKKDKAINNINNLNNSDSILDENKNNKINNSDESIKNDINIEKRNEINQLNITNNYKSGGNNLINIINQTDKIINIKINSTINNRKDFNKTIELKNSDTLHLEKINEVNIKSLTKKNNTIKDLNDNKINENNLEKHSVQNFDKLIIKISMVSTCIIFIIFISFNIILCKDNYINIQNRKNENNINQYEFVVQNEEMSLFNDSI